MTDPLEFIDEMADQIQLWSDRAEYWRQVAIEFAAGQRSPYGVPVAGALRLREATPRRLDWGPLPLLGMPAEHVADKYHLQHWWVDRRRQDRPLGMTELFR